MGKRGELEYQPLEGEGAHIVGICHLFVEPDADRPGGTGVEELGLGEPVVLGLRLRFHHQQAGLAAPEPVAVGGSRGMNQHRAGPALALSASERSKYRPLRTTQT